MFLFKMALHQACLLIYTFCLYYNLGCNLCQSNENSICKSAPLRYAICIAYRRVADLEVLF